MNRAETRYTTRRAAFAELRKRYSSNVAFSDALGDGFGPSFVSQLLGGHRNIGDDVASKIEQRLRLDSGWMDSGATHDVVSDPNTNPAPPLNPRQQALLELFDGLPASEQDRMLRELEEKKQRYDALYEELKARKQA